MNPIISPLYFYLIFLGESLGFPIVLCGMGLLVAAAMIAFENGITKIVKKLFIFGILCFTLESLIPNESTCYKMMAASMVTPNNIEAVGTTAESVVDYIVESVDKLMEEKENESDN